MSSASGGGGSDVSPGEPPPLVVDVDGTLLRGDLLWEGVLRLCLSRPWRVGALLAAVTHGRAAGKAFVAREADLSVDSLPLEPMVLELIRAARAEGRSVVLASGAHQTQVAALGAAVGVDATMGSDDLVSLTGEKKLQRLQSRYARFDYVGNGHADLPLWVAARRAIAVNASAAVLHRVRRVRADVVVLGSAVRGRAWLRALRPHQWAKNALLFLPALAAHLPWTPTLAGRLLLGFLAFSAVASTVYLLNDLVDLPHDRRHPTKRHRPLAAGDISVPTALLGLAGLAATGILLAWRLPPMFRGLLAIYAILSTGYSLGLKQRTLVDVMTLTTLYTLRLMAGGVLASVVLSQWFLAFSVFFFFSLALLKRVVELRAAPASDAGPISGRPYGANDVPTLTAFGAAASAASSLVYCLYITSESVGRLYSRPHLLWLGFLLVIYWQARVWLFAGRGAMHEDPIVFALRDRISHLVLVAFLLTALVAA